MKYIPVFLHGGLSGADFRAKLTEALPVFELIFYDSYAGFIENIETNKPPVIIIVPGNITIDEHQKMSAVMRFARQSGSSVLMISSVRGNTPEDISILNDVDLVISESIGSDKWSRIISSLFPDEDEKVQALLQPEEEDLRDSKRQFSTLIENLPGIAYQCKNDQNWTMHFISKNVKQLTGYQADDLIDSKLISFSELILPEDRDYVSETILNSVGKSKPFKLEYRIKTRQGGIKWVWEQGRIVRLKHKTESLLEGFIIDISERKMAEIRAEIMHNIPLRSMKQKI